MYTELVAKKKKKPETTRTYHTRLEGLGPVEESILRACAGLFSKVERTIFASLQAGKTISEIKPAFCARFSITARHFNGCSAEVGGLIRSKMPLRNGPSFNMMYGLTFPARCGLLW